MIEDRVEVRKGDLLFLHTGWHKHAQFGSEPDEEKYIHRHPGAHPDMVPWLLEKEIHIWGVDCVSTDHPMNLPIGRFLGKGMHGHCDRVRKQCEDKFGGPEAVNRAVSRLRLPADAQRALPEELHAHREPRRRHRRARAAEQAAHPRAAFRGSSKAARPRSRASWRLPASGSREGCESAATAHGGRRRECDTATARRCRRSELRWRIPRCVDRPATELRRLSRARRVGRRGASRRASSASSG